MGMRKTAFRKILKTPTEQTIDGGRKNYLKARDKLTRILIDETVVGSYWNFKTFSEPYPFVDPESLRPGSVTGSKEYELQKSALVILLDGELPEVLRKNFRCWKANRVQKKNISSVAPDINLDHYKKSNHQLNHKNFNVLMKTLLPLDLALLAQGYSSEKGEEKTFKLSHFHVKIERLTDHALRRLGIYLNYLEEDLLERGEPFVEALEKKFYEYFNFYHNAAGRRTASALAVQLLVREKITGTVFVSSQQDRRLTLLSSDNDKETDIEQYLLLRLCKKSLKALKHWGKEHNVNIQKNYLVDEQKGMGVVVLRVRYEHTEVSRPTPDGRLRKNVNFKKRWIRLREEAIISLNPKETLCIGFPVAYEK